LLQGGLYGEGRLAKRKENGVWGHQHEAKKAEQI